MDRFIGNTTPINSINELDLKSNMDRFIEKLILSALQRTIYLKSNMDRFIGVHKSTHKNDYGI